MDKGYSGLNPYKAKTSSPGQGRDGTTRLESRTEAMCIYENIAVVKMKKDDNTGAHKGKNKHPYSNPKYAPIKIPSNAEIKKKSKNGYEQVKYIWKKGKYKYEARWHTSTPNSPNKKQSWVITRIKSGSKGSRKEVMVRSGNKWVPWNKWKEAITAKKKGTATKTQIKILNKGHFTKKRGKK